MCSVYVMCVWVYCRNGSSDCAAWEVLGLQQSPSPKPLTGAGGEGPSPKPWEPGPRRCMCWSRARRRLRPCSVAGNGGGAPYSVLGSFGGWAKPHPLPYSVCRFRCESPRIVFNHIPGHPWFNMVTHKISHHPPGVRPISPESRAGPGLLLLHTPCPGKELV